MTLRKILLIAIVVLAFIGMLNAAYVTYLTFVQIPSATGPLICDINDTWSCSQALQLKATRVFGIPSCTIALAVYPIIIAVAMLGYSGRIRWHFPALAALGIGGMALNGYVLSVNATYGVYCLFCVACGVIVSLIFASAVA